MIRRLRSPSPRRAAAAALVLGLFAATACADPSGGGPASASRPVPLLRDAPEPERLGAFLFRGAVEVTGGPEVGGLSGLAITDGGRQFVAIEDVGRVVFGRLRHQDGRLVGVDDLMVKPLPGIGQRQGRAREDDSEEVVALPDGGWLVSFEGHHRILRYPPGFAGEPVALPLAAGMAELPLNGGLEALTRLSDGRLLALAEGADDGVPERRAWIGRVPLKGPDDWAALTYRAAPGFRPTGAAALPDGGVLVLERYFTILGGPAARIVRIAAGALVPGAVIDGEELARIQPPLLTDNYEGIAVTPGTAGETLVYVVSDDNFNTTVQRTYLLMLALPASR